MNLRTQKNGRVSSVRGNLVHLICKVNPLWDRKRRSALGKSENIVLDNFVTETDSRSPADTDVRGWLPFVAKGHCYLWEMQEKRGVLGILGSKALGEARGGCQTRVNKKIDSHIRRGPPGLVNLYLPACDLVQTRAGSKCNRHR
jgi:hypothetical protein